jgi:hypothetical protein
MSGIFARIKIRHTQGAELAYIYEKEVLDEIGLKPTKYDPTETFFNVGDQFFLEDRQYKVIAIHTKFLNETYYPDGKKGINLFGIGEQQPFNFQITYEVDNV